MGYRLPGGNFDLGLYNHGEVAAGVQIVHGASRKSHVVVTIANTSGVLVTMTALPTLQPGAFDGQELELRVTPGSTNAINLQDESALAGSGLRLAATPQQLNARDAIRFRWNAGESAWHCSSARVNNL